MKNYNKYLSYKWKYLQSNELSNISQRMISNLLEFEKNIKKGHFQVHVINYINLIQEIHSFLSELDEELDEELEVIRNKIIIIEEQYINKINHDKDYLNFILIYFMCQLIFEGNLFFIEYVIITIRQELLDLYINDDEIPLVYNYIPGLNKTLLLFIKQNFLTERDSLDLKEPQIYFRIINLLLENYDKLGKNDKLLKYFKSNLKILLEALQEFVDSIFSGDFENNPEYTQAKEAITKYINSKRVQINKIIYNN